MANAENCKVVLDHLLEHPEYHEQSMYSCPADNECGTVGCVAGWTVMLLGTEEEKERALGADRRMFPDEFFDRATEILGLTQKQAYDLFLTTWNNDDALIKLKEYANGE